MYEISEQQINPKVLSVTSSCHYMEIPKWQKSFIDKCPPLGSYLNKSPSPSPPWPKARMHKPQGGGKICGGNPWGCVGGMVMDEIDTCIDLLNSEN